MDRFFSLQGKRHDGLPSLDPIAQGFDTPSFRTPQFRRFSGDTEARFKLFGTVLAVQDEIAVLIVHLAVNERQFRIGLRAGKAEIRLHPQRRQGFFDVRTCYYAPFAHFCDRAPRPQFGHQLLPFRAVITQSGAVFRGRADDGRAAFDKGGQTPQHRERHASAASTQIEDLVARAARADQVAAIVADRIHKRPDIDEVVGVARRRVGNRLIAIQGGQRTFFAIEIGHIGKVAAALQHVTVARDIIDPRFRQIGPGVVPVEVLAENHQRQSRLTSLIRTVDRCVDDRTVDTRHKLQIYDMLQGARTVGPVPKRRSHGFSRDQILSVDMRDRRGALHVRNVGREWLPCFGECPKRRHGNVCKSAHRHIVA